MSTNTKTTPKDVKAKVLRGNLCQHGFEDGETVIMGECIDEQNKVYEFWNLDKTDYWYMPLSQVMFGDSGDKVSDSNESPETSEFVNNQVLLKRGDKATIACDLSLSGYTGDYPLVGYLENGTVLQWSLDGEIYGLSDSMNIVGLVGCIEYPEGMWDVVDPKWEYLAIDEDGESWFFTSKPYIDTDGSIGFWEQDGVGDFEQNHVIPVTTTDWTKSLTKRPDNSK